MSIGTKLSGNVIFLSTNDTPMYRRFHWRIFLISYENISIRIIYSNWETLVNVDTFGVLPAEVYIYRSPLSLLGLFWSITSLYIRGEMGMRSAQVLHRQAGSCLIVQRRRRWCVPTAGPWNLDHRPSRIDSAASTRLLSIY